MKTQKTLEKMASAIVADLNGRNIGTHLHDIYHNYSDDKLYYYNKCRNSIQVGARNIEYGVYPCGSWSFVFLAQYDIEARDCEFTRHSLTVYKRFTRDTTTCIVYDWNSHKYYTAKSCNSYFDLDTSETEHIHILHIVDGLED